MGTSSTCGGRDGDLYRKCVRVLTSQDQTTSDCALGTSCHGGLRRVRLSD